MLLFIHSFISYLQNSWYQSQTGLDMLKSYPIRKADHYHLEQRMVSTTVSSTSHVVSSNITVKCLDIKRGEPASAHVTLDRARADAAAFPALFNNPLLLKSIVCFSISALFVYKRPVTLFCKYFEVGHLPRLKVGQAGFVVRSALTGYLPWFMVKRCFSFR